MATPAECGHAASGVLFDLDETLIDRTASVENYARTFWQSFRMRLNLAEEAFVIRLLELDGNGYVPREQFFQLLAAEIALEDMDAAAVRTHYYQHIFADPFLMEGAVEGLVRLRDEGVRLGIVSNGATANQMRKISDAGLDRLVDGCFISEAVGVKKPDPRIFETACRALDIEPGRSWFVGDHPLFDVHASIGLGFRSIWIRRRTPWPESEPPCYTAAVDDLSEAMAILGRHYVGRE